MKGLKLKPKAKPKMAQLGPMDAKGVTGLTGAMNALGAGRVAPSPVPPTPGPPSAPADDVEPPSSPAAPMPAVGATDGLGSGMGGLAVHPSLRAAKIHGREPKHSSKTR